MKIFQEAPDPLPEEELLELIQQLKAGENVGDKIIYHHLKIVKNIVQRYVRRCPHKREYLEAEGLFWLTQAVRWIPERLKHDNATGFIISHVRGALIHYLIKDFVIKYPPNYDKSKVDNIENYVKQCIVKMSTLDQGLLVFDQPDEESEVLELLEAAKLDDTEIDIVMKYLSGWSKKDIATEYARSQAWVTIQFKNIRRKYQCQDESS